MKQLLILFAAIFLLSSCSGGTQEGKKRTKPAKSTTISAPYELLVVANKEWLKGPYGTVLMDAVNAEIPGLPQLESNFRVTSINPADLNGTFKVYANMLHVDINPKHKEAKLVLSRDVYVRPQVILNLQAPDEKALVELVRRSRGRIVDVFVEEEMKRERAYLTSVHSGVVFDAVKKKFGCSIYAPQDLDAINKNGKDFVWSSANGRDNELNLCVYTYPYSSDSTFTLKYFAHKRDSVMRENVQGERPDQYMETDVRTLVESHSKGVNGYVHVVRGLWGMKNDMMGGPFVSYSQVDTAKNVVVVAEGFVYAPEKRKRDFIREMEASLQTLTLL